MGLTKFNIQFEKPLKIFFPVEEVRGRVTVDLSSEKKFRQIKLEVVGRGEVHWTETRTRTRRGSDGKTETETVTDHYRERFSQALLSSLLIGPFYGSHLSLCHKPAQGTQSPII